MSSDKDEDFDHHPRELQTGSSDEEGEGPSKRAAHYLPTAPNSLAAITSTAKGSEGDNMMEIDSAFGGNISSVLPTNDPRHKHVR